jgi:hypothetical protein
MSGTGQLYSLIHLFNGNLVYGWKRKQFQSWLAAYNNQYTQHVLVKQCQLVPSFSNAWLCGLLMLKVVFPLGKNVPRVKWIESICRFFIGAKHVQIL